MQSFIQRHAAKVIGVLSGFDRVRLRGTLRWLANRDGMRNYLFAANILFKDFKDYVMGVTERIRAASHRLAEEAGRPLLYLNSTAISKEETARQIAERDGVKEGLICVLTCTEPCYSYHVRRNPEKRLLELHGERRKCLHHYFYFQHSEFGLMHLRLQTWFPFQVMVCVNGRLWLARQLDHSSESRV